MPPLNQEVFAWLGGRGAAPAGAPFWKYNVIDMAAKLEIEAGVPVAAAVAGDDRVVSGVLPAGRYATLTHVGHPSELMAATKSAAGLGRRTGPDLGRDRQAMTASGGPAGWRTT